MALCRDKIDKGKVRRYFNDRTGKHKYYKHCINKIVRRMCKNVDEDSYELRIKKPYRGWEH